MHFQVPITQQYHSENQTSRESQFTQDMEKTNIILFYTQVLETLTTSISKNVS